MLWWFAETTLVAALLAVVAALLGRVARVGPGARHVLWLVVLVKLLTPPIVHSPWPVWQPEGRGSGQARTAHQPEPLAGPDRGPAIETRPHVRPEHVRLISTGELAPTTRAEEPVRETPSPAASAGAESRRLVTFQDRLDRFEATAVPGFLIAGWMAGATLIGLIQTVRILRFHSRLRQAVPAPSWLAVEVEDMGARLGVRVPEILVGPHRGTPMLWCLGRPKLVVPGQLLTSIDAASWRGILAHELAHLRRGDHWINRLELIAGLIWWWNPLYWIARCRLDAEAELACDAWVVWALPDERLTYAEVLFQVCSEYSLATSAGPVLRVAGSGRFLERRLTMILRDQVSCRISPLTVLAASLLTVLALPSWTPARAKSQTEEDGGTTAVRNQDSERAVRVAFRIDDRNDATDDDEKPQKPAQRDKTRKPDAHDAKGDHEDAKTEADAAEFEEKIEAWAERFAGEIEARFGENSEFVKKMEAFGKEMEKKFGEDSEFVKNMEAFGKEMEKKFGDGSEFARNMEAFGKEMEKKFGPGSDFEKNIAGKFGPGSDFEKQMKSMGEKMEKKFGPGSDMEKRMKEMSEKMEKKFGPGSDMEKRMKAMGEKMEKKFGPGSDFEKKIKEKMDAEEAKARASELKAKKDVSAAGRSQEREARVKALEAQLEAIQSELKSLRKAEADDDDDDE